MYKYVKQNVFNLFQTGHEIPLGKVSSSYSLDLSSSNNTSVSTIGEDLTKKIVSVWYEFCLPIKASLVQIKLLF